MWYIFPMMQYFYLLQMPPGEKISVIFPFTLCPAYAIALIPAGIKEDHRVTCITNATSNLLKRKSIKKDYTLLYCKYVNNMWLIKIGRTICLSKCSVLLETVIEQKLKLAFNC